MSERGFKSALLAICASVCAVSATHSLAVGGVTFFALVAIVKMLDSR